MVNFLNINQALRANKSDEELASIVLGLRDVTSELIKSHMGEERPTNAKFLTRDPVAYRDFLLDIIGSKREMDHFSQFYLKESKPNEHAK